MTKVKKILIETDSIETFTVRIKGKEVISGFCESCGAETEMLDLNTAVSISGLAARELIQDIEAGTIHSPEIATGHLLICKNSLHELRREAKYE